MYDPVTLWMQSSLFWIRVFKQQQEAYLRLLGSVAVAIPHENAAELAREADALKKTLKPARRSTTVDPALAQVAEKPAPAKATKTVAKPDRAPAKAVAADNPAPTAAKAQKTAVEETVANSEGSAKPTPGAKDAAKAMPATRSSVDAPAAKSEPVAATSVTAPPAKPASVAAVPVKTDQVKTDQAKTDQAKTAPTKAAHLTAVPISTKLASA